jgi:L-ribulose-5-phosphate 3-epimerase
MRRRDFLKLSAVSIGSLSLTPAPLFAQRGGGLQSGSSKEPFLISLAEWSLNKTLRAGKMTNLDFPRVAKRDFNIDCIEFVDQFFADKAQDMSYLRELKTRAEGEGVKMGLIMIDTTGDFGAAEKADRDKAIEKTFPWIDAAKFLGCHTVRINARGPGSADELRDKIVESCSRLADYAAPRDLNIAIENHGKLSSDPAWLSSVMQAVNKPNFGTLPDFGNFPSDINRYDAVETLMPWAKAVSAKASRINAEGWVEETDFFKMMRIVRDFGYSSYVGIESSPSKQEEEYDYIRKTRDLLLKVREHHRRVPPIFNGRDLTGWTKIEGGEWTVENGVLIGRNGQNWSTNPERTGSWLSTENQYQDFRLELQFSINKGGNSGVFFRSLHERNPAFTGYEMQIHDSPGRPPGKGGPGSLYDVIAPAKNMIRQAGQWNYATILARGPKIIVEMNGERIIETEQTRSLKGYIGLQNHDARSEVRFKNIRLEEL